MKLNEKARIFVPGGKDAEEAVGKTTHLAISAHQDDIEIMAYSGVADCYGQRDKFFAGVVVTNGGGSPRSGIYADYTDREMILVREDEQNAAAAAGGYAAMFHLKYPSSSVKDATSLDVRDDLKEILLAARPKIVFTHNLADMHDTHVAVVLRVIAALRDLRGIYSPQKLYGMEVWRSLDWCGDKELFDTSGHPNLAAALLGVYDSQICGGKRYDLATLGRRSANATFNESHSVDEVSSGSFGIDMTSLIHGESTRGFVLHKIDAFKADVARRLEKLGG
jgi:LmbE family N-acetylglucosaminyl deacetylase